MYTVIGARLKFNLFCGTMFFFKFKDTKIPECGGGYKSEGG